MQSKKRPQSVFLVLMLLTPPMLVGIFAGLALGDEGGPDGFGYSWMDSNLPSPTITYNWIEISGTGVDSGVTGDDVVSGAISMGFNFDFYDNTYNQLYFSTNGLITFGSSSPSYSNTALPSTSGPENLIGVYWDVLTTGTPGVIYYETRGSAPNRQFILEWYQVRRFGGSSSNLMTFEAIMYETGEIILQYNTLIGENGNSATVGIENETGQTGLQYSYNSASLSNSLAIRFSNIVLDHDIAVINIQAPSYTEPNLPTTVNATIMNNGINDESSIQINLTVDGVQVDTTTIGFLQNMTSTNVSFAWTPILEGNFTVGIEAHTVSGENVTTNNNLSTPILVRHIAGNILFDQTHSTDSINSYDTLIDALIYEGFLIDTHDSGTIDSNTFVGYEVFVIPQAGTSYSLSERTAIQNFVDGGGGLLVIGDDSTSIYTALTGFANITWSSGGSSGTTTDITSHSITLGVSSVALSAPIARMQVSGNATSLVRDSGGSTMLAVSEVPGRVAGFVDEDTLMDGGIGNADNLVLAINLFRWLSIGKYDHDITIINLQAPGIIEPDEQVYINATIINSGLNNENNVEINLTVNGIWEDSITLPTLNSGSWAGISFSWSGSLVGSYLVGIVITPVPQENITTNNALYANITARIVIGRVLFDQTHGTDSITLYSQWVADLENEGFIADTHDSGTISSSTFSGYDVFVIPQATSSYGFSERTAIQDFVIAGGGLFVFGDYSSYYYGTLTGFADIDWTTGGASGYTAHITPHRITENVTSVYMSSPYLELLTSGSTRALIRDNFDNIMLAVAWYPGKVAGFPDQSSFRDTTINQGNNLILATNIIKWLNEEPPAPATNLTVDLVPAGESLSLSWDASSDSTIVGYELFRSDDSGQNFVSIANTTQTSYVDTGLVDGDSYQYFVLAYTDDSVYSTNTSIINGIPDTDSDLDGIYDMVDTDDDNDDMSDIKEFQMGLNRLVQDTDGDGHIDGSDQFPSDATQWADSDADGWGDDPSGNNPDAFPNDHSEYMDSDGDGHGDFSDRYPEDSEEWMDSDGDGTGDNGDFLPNMHNTIFNSMLAFIIVLIVILISMFILFKMKKLQPPPEVKDEEEIHDGPVTGEGEQTSTLPRPPHGTQETPTSNVPPSGQEPSTSDLSPSDLEPQEPSLGDTVVEKKVVGSSPPASPDTSFSVLEDIFVAGAISEDTYKVLMENVGTPKWGETLSNLLAKGDIPEEIYSELVNLKE